MIEKYPKLSLYRPASYEIIVPGHLDDLWSEWGAELSVTHKLNSDGKPITALIGMLDQAALQGLLRRLYSLGLPLISVNCLEVE